jgi:DNA (cytosine-5)-methyltransferase 1
MARTTPPRTLDLFCGIGGLSLGLKNAGLSTVGGIDNWEDAAKTFMHNLRPLKCLVSDIRETAVDDIEEFFSVSKDDIDIIAGGPPCQGYSTVGKRDSSDPRNDLWRHYLELVGQVRPAYVLIENVEGLVVMDRGAVRDNIISSFASLGYRMTSRLLRSADYGVPQLRKRVVFLGWLDGLVKPEFPKPHRAPPVTVGDAIFDLPELQSGESRSEYEVAPQTRYQRERRCRSRMLHNHEAAKHPASLVEVLRHIPDGGNRKAIPDHLQPRSGFHNSYSRLASDKPAVAVTSNMRKPSSARATHPTQHRGLTVREGLRLQSFDDSFVVLGCRTSQYLQVGNAVPPLLGKALGEELLRAFLQNTKAQLRRARSMPAKPLKNETVDGSQFLLRMTD